MGALARLGFVLLVVLFFWMRSQPAMDPKGHDLRSCIHFLRFREARQILETRLRKFHKREDQIYLACVGLRQDMTPLPHGHGSTRTSDGVCRLLMDLTRKDGADPTAHAMLALHFALRSDFNEVKRHLAPAAMADSNPDLEPLRKWSAGTAEAILRSGQVQPEIWRHIPDSER